MSKKRSDLKLKSRGFNLN